MLEATTAATMLVVLAPVLVMVALMIKATSKGPIFYWSPRIGKDNRVFSMPKFRTMKIDAPMVATHLLKDPDSYLTPIGALLRRTSVDELPQLVAILKGDIAFVGPRPALFNQYDLIELRTKQGIHELTPGITGWAQVNGRDAITIEQKVELDNYYRQRRSLLFDLRIIALTLAKVVSGEGVAH